MLVLKNISHNTYIFPFIFSLSCGANEKCQLGSGTISGACPNELGFICVKCIILGISNLGQEWPRLE